MRLHVASRSPPRGKRNAGPGRGLSGGWEGSRQLRDAWERAEVATRKLGYLLDAYVAVRPLVEAAFDQVDETAGQTKAAKGRR